MNKNNSRTASKARMLKKLTKTQWVLLGIFVVLLLAAVVYAVFAFQSTRDSLELAKTGQTEETKDSASIDPKAEEATSPDTSEHPLALPQNNTEPGEPVFSDTSGWVTKNSRDGLFSIKYNQYLMYTTCSDLGDNLLIALVFGTTSSIECESVQEAVSVQPVKGEENTIRLLTETMIAQTDVVADRGGAIAAVKTLTGGQVAQRYEYDTVVLGKFYHVIEYNATVGGKRYVAINSWQDTKAPNMSVVDFDTMIQKTWMFN